MNERRKNRIEAYYQNKIPNIEILIDNVWDPHNVAAVARTADGLGISVLDLYYTYNEFPKLHKVGKKTSASANQWIRFEKIENLSKFVEQKRSAGFQFLGTGMGGNAKQLNLFQFPEKCVIIMGSESTGMSPELKEICDELIYIPMVGMVTSYNISVAAALIMYEIFSQKGNALQMKPEEDFCNNYNRGRLPPGR
ncbi:MAG: RNA methyltransferase [SAR324 cluster bacterium]|nr:RNA methyltransferase [SAR324 cluster bacterium]